LDDSEGLQNPDLMKTNLKHPICKLNSRPFKC
jgi:hypothetical protein